MQQKKQAVYVIDFSEPFVYNHTENTLDGRCFDQIP